MSVSVLVFFNKYFDVVSVHKHLFSDLHEGYLAIPYLAPPEPHGSADFGSQFFYPKKTFCGCCRVRLSYFHPESNLKFIFPENLFAIFVASNATKSCQ